MECPVCNGNDVYVDGNIEKSDCIEIEMYCIDCGEITAFARVGNDQWISVKDSANSKSQSGNIQIADADIPMGICLKCGKTLSSSGPCCG